MADHNSGSRFVELPPELMRMILNNTGKKQLKVLRATNRFLNKLVTPELFNTFSLFPHVRSFEQLLEAGRTPHVGPHIRHLEYVNGYLGVTKMIHRRIESVYSASISAEEKKSMLDRASELQLQNLDAEEKFDELALLSHIQSVLAVLPCLQSIRIADVNKTTSALARCAPLPTFYELLCRETCGRFEHTRLERGMLGSGVAEATHVRAWLMALPHLKGSLTSLELHKVRWSFLAHYCQLAKHQSFWQKAFEGLQRLEISSEESCEPPQYPEGNMMLYLQDLLRPATNLEYLSIEFRSEVKDRLSGEYMIELDTDMPCRSDFWNLKHGTAVGVQPAVLCWSIRLQGLCIRGLVCTANEIRSVLRTHARTLRRLEVSEFLLLPDLLPGPRACLVSLLTWMRKHLRLETVEFRGRLTNWGMQSWFVDPDAQTAASPENLLSQVQRYILHGGSNPLEHVAIVPGDFDLHKKNYSAEVPESLKDSKYKGDHTFGMQYSHDDSELSYFSGGDEEEEEEEAEDDYDDYNDYDDDEEDVEDEESQGLYSVLAAGSIGGPPSFNGFADFEAVDANAGHNNEITWLAAEPFPFSLSTGPSSQPPHTVIAGQHATSIPPSGPANPLLFTPAQGDPSQHVSASAIQTQGGPPRSDDNHRMT